MKPLSELRQEMDALSLQIAKLLLQRRELAHKIFRIKGHLNMPVWDPQREEDLLEILIQQRSQEETVYLQEIFKEILKQTRGSS